MVQINVKQLNKKMEQRALQVCCKTHQYEFYGINISAPLEYNEIICFYISSDFPLNGEEYWPLVLIECRTLWPSEAF